METNDSRIILLIIAVITWLVVLYRILTRQDFDTVTKILWVIVVIFVPFFGVILYWIAAPAEISTSKKSLKPSGGSDVPGPPWADDPGHTPGRSDVSGTPWADDPGHTHQ